MYTYIYGYPYWLFPIGYSLARYSLLACSLIGTSIPMSWFPQTRGSTPRRDNRQGNRIAL